MRATSSMRQLLWTYLRPQWRKVAALAALLLTSIGLQLANPLILAAFIDAATAGGTPRDLTWRAVVYLALAVATQAITAAATYLGLAVAWTATNQLREDLALHCLRLDMGFLNTKTPGEFIERIDGDLTALSNFFSEFVFRILGSALLLVGIVALLLRENLALGVATLGFVTVVALALRGTRVIAVPAGKVERQASANVFGFVEERLGGMDDIRANGGGAFVMRRFHDTLRALFYSGRKVWMMRSLIGSVNILLYALGYVIVFALGAYLFQSHAITLGAVYLFFQYNEMIQNPLEQLTKQMQDFQKAASSIARIREMFALQPAVADVAGTTLPSGALEVDFDGVTFGYGAAPTLSDLTFAIPAGTTLGLLGRTGSGKTTIGRLICRLYDPRAGEIRLGGVATRDAGIGEIRRRIGVVTQDVQLFHATVRDNLTLFDDTISDTRILAVMRDMGLGEWFARLPAGLDTPLDARGAGLSAGEAQLLAFIRVFLRDPGLVILDEPTSRLDPATEALIARAVGALLAGRTGIIIAHRLATVRRAEAILVLEDGMLAEFGAREDLERDATSRYAGLLRAGREEVLA